MHDIWNPWHGCKKCSEGCENCYMYFLDAQRGRNGADIYRTKVGFKYPLSKDRSGHYKVKSGEQLRVCMTSDFFLEDADVWRGDAWRIMKERSDCHFFFITKRIDRFHDCIPDDWGDGYDNVSIAVTTENQRMADYRLPIYLGLPIKHKSIVCEPLLEAMDISKYLTDCIESVSVGGESGPNARVCNYDWVLDIHRQCIEADVGFDYHQTGAKLLKGGKLYNIPRNMQGEQAKKANIDYKKAES